jgi:hypothetical protein
MICPQQEHPTAAAADMPSGVQHGALSAGQLQHRGRRLPCWRRWRVWWRASWALHRQSTSR